MAHPQPIGVALALECVIVGGVFGPGHHGDTLHDTDHDARRSHSLRPRKNPKHFELDLRAPLSGEMMNQRAH